MRKIIGGCLVAAPFLLAALFCWIVSGSVLPVLAFLGGAGAVLATVLSIAYGAHLMGEA
jgi:hypothetical protein